MRSGEGHFYDRYVLRQGGAEDEGRIGQMCRLLPADAASLLDVGCSDGRNLRVFRKRLPNARLCGTDIGETMGEMLRAQGFEFVPADASRGLPFHDQSFDVVTCGEVIEHIFDPDTMLDDLRRVLAPNGVLIITTPNLAYLPNRVLLALGVQPIFSEVSLLRNYGRFHRVLGQGNEAQGHLRLFTLPALLEMLADHRFDICGAFGYRWLHRGVVGVVDRLIAIRPSFAAGFVVAARRR